MSRSRRKTPIFGNTAAPSDKPFKKRENRRARRTTSEALTGKEFGNPWASEKDGKHYWRDATDKDMRK